jgi:predicted ATPase
VNLASRLQALAEPGAVMLSDRTQRLVEGMVDSRFVGEHPVKGKAQPQRVFQLEGIRKGTMRFDAAVNRGLTAYVGRDHELEMLERHLAETTPCVQVIDIVGEPGIGKSRLLYEFRQRLGRSRVFILSGSCSADGQQTPFRPFIEIVRGSFRVAPGEVETTLARKLDSGLKLLGLESLENLGLILNLLGLTEPHGVLLGLDSTLIGLRTRDLLQQLLQRRCRLSPVVMLIEDLHWTDSASEELLGKIIGSVDQLPLLVLHTRRPEYRMPWCTKQNVSQLALGPLSVGDTARIVETRLGTTKLPEGMARVVAEKSGGNPLFAEEIASFLVERGAVRRTAGGVEFDGAKVVGALPANVQSLLTSRVDRLSSDERAVL